MCVVDHHINYFHTYKKKPQTVPLFSEDILLTKIILFFNFYMKFQVNF